MSEKALLSPCCRLDLHAQGADDTQLSEEDRKFTAGIVNAGKNIFLPSQGSLWTIAAQLFPFLLPTIRLIAERFPDKHLVGHTSWKTQFYSFFVHVKSLDLLLCIYQPLSPSRPDLEWCTMPQTGSGPMDGPSYHNPVCTHLIGHLAITFPAFLKFSSVTVLKSAFLHSSDVNIINTS